MFVPLKSSLITEGAERRGKQNVVTIGLDRRCMTENIL